MRPRRPSPCPRRPAGTRPSEAQAAPAATAPARPTSLPDIETLACGLASVLGGTDPLIILNRQPVLPTMTFPAETVTCRLGRGRRMKLFCKYQCGRNHNAYGHRGGVGYEAEVYRRLLRPMQGTTPRFVGAWREPTSGDHWLLLEYLEHSRLLRDVSAESADGDRPAPILLAAQWIGKFHAEARVHQAGLPFLNRYNPAYYLGWARRTADLAGPLRYPWLARLCGRAGELLAPLLQAGTTVIHGEYYQNNILIRDTTVHPTDWESAAVAPGEIDLAALTEGPWDRDIVRQCQREYRQARWPQGPPAEFERTLAAARLYLHFRWLGERADWTHSPDSHWRIEELRSIAAAAATDTAATAAVAVRSPGLRRASICRPPRGAPVSPPGRPARSGKGRAGVVG